jgi:hypothetical protein
MTYLSKAKELRKLSTAERNLAKPLMFLYGTEGGKRGNGL